MKENYDDEDYNDSDKSPILSRKISSIIELKLEDDQTNVYIDGDYVETCMNLKIIIPKNNIKDYDHINSIDELSEHISDSDLENESYSIDPEEEFWGHCSNIQAWVENDYDTRILHSNIAFPLLKRLTNIGDLLARNVFKEEIAERFSSGEKIVILFLLEDDYLNYLDEFEKINLFESVKINFFKFTISEFYHFVNLCEKIFLEMGIDARSSFLMNNLNEISNLIVEHVSEPKFDGRKLHTLYESLNKLMFPFIRYEKLFFDYKIANYKIKKHFSTNADAEIRNDRTLFIQYKKDKFYTETNFSYSLERYDVFLDLKNALFGDENVIFSNINTNISAKNFNNLIVEVILSSKKAEEFFSENFPTISDWFKYKQNVINQLTDLEQKDLDFTDKINLIYLILWNLLYRRPKQTEMRFIKQANFFFEITEFYNARDCNVAIEMFDNNNLHQGEFGQEQSFVLIVKNRNEQFHREYRDEELHDIIKLLFFRDENLTIDFAFWRRHQQIFEIDVKFDSKEN